MSRVPRPTASANSLRSQYRASSPTKISSPSTPSRLRVPAATPAKHPTSTPNKSTDGWESPSKERLSLKEQIALRRAEAKKAQMQQNPGVVVGTFGADDDPMALKNKKAEDDIDELGRWSIRETIEHARSTGNLNLSARSLVCIPSCLYEIHLGITPEPPKSVTEPEYPIDDNPKRQRQNRKQPSWFDAQDLTILKARNNEIVEIQPEISLFGSLKIIDFHNNRMETLPASLTNLSMLTSLDLSNNKLTQLPPCLFSLPALTILNLSHNQLASLPFSRFESPLELADSLRPGGFFEPAVVRAAQPLPKLHSLDVGYNKLTSDAIDHAFFPSAITHLTLAHNPLGSSSGLFIALAKLDALQELHIEGAAFGDDSLHSGQGVKFSKLRVMDLAETQVTEQAVRTFFAGSEREPELTFDMTTTAPSAGELRVTVGKRVIRETWEIEADQRYLRKKKSSVNIGLGTAPQAQSTAPKAGASNGRLAAPQIEKEAWEIEAEQGLFSEGARRRARTAAAAATTSTVPASSTSKKATSAPKAVEKEAWEIEAEQGLLTEGGRRRARAQQAARPTSPELDTASSSSTGTASSLTNSTYYRASTLTLTLPPSAPPTRGHARTFSLVASPQKRGNPEDLLIPTPTLPLCVLARQNFAATLRVLTLTGRRADPTFNFPSASFLSAAAAAGGALPCLDELYLDGCGLGDSVPVVHEPDEEGGQVSSRKEPLLELIADNFPALSILDLSYNALTTDALNPAVLYKLLAPFAASPTQSGRKALKALRLRGNRLTGLDALEGVASLFRGNRQVPEWRLEELDVRDNDIARLPVLLGLMPLDVLLVDGNTFRVPARKVWEREGTKGLLSWLRGRIE